MHEITSRPRQDNSTPWDTYKWTACHINLEHYHTLLSSLDWFILHLKLQGWLYMCEGKEVFSIFFHWLMFEDCLTNINHGYFDSFDRIYDLSERSSWLEGWLKLYEKVWPTLTVVLQLGFLQVKGVEFDQFLWGFCWLFWLGLANFGRKILVLP